MAGFGNYPFGNHPFGHSDYGMDTVVKSFPEAYKIDDEGNPNEVLLHYLYAIKDSRNRVKEKIDNLSDQVDVDKIEQAILPYLGSTFDLKLDDSEPVDFQRSLVGNATFFYRIKGIKESYKIRGKISGFDVETQNLYRIDPAYEPLIPVDDIFEIPVNSGVFYTDLPPGSVVGTPTEIDCTYCLTTVIKLNFTVVKPQPAAILGAPNLFDRLVYKLKDIIPIHVRDVLYEIRVYILADIHQDMDISCRATEDLYIPAHLSYYFDSVPSDVVPCDLRSYVTGFADETIVP